MELPVNRNNSSANQSLVRTANSRRTVQAFAREVTMTKEQRMRSSETIKTTAGVLRDIITIIMALAFTGSIAAFLTSNGSTPVDLGKISPTRILIFVCIITTIVRFYHGNVSYLNNTYSVADAEAGIRRYRYKLACDFLFFFIQSVIFCALAVYQPRVRDFYVLFILLLLVDALWCLVNVWFSRVTFREFEAAKAQEHLRSQINWMLANVVAAGLLFVPMISRWAATPEEVEKIVPYLSGVILVNAVVDYWSNRRLYFPGAAARHRRRRAFVAARFTSALTSHGFDPALRKLIESAHDVARSKHFMVRSAHEEESFGKALAKPEDFVLRDLEEVADSDLFIAVLDHSVSPGTMIEIGWASVCCTNTSSFWFRRVTRTRITL
jgi:hypothetical protein